MKRGAERGFTITVFVPEGSASGLRIVTKSNWNGLGIVCPRTSFGEARKRKEFSKPGVYLLFGPSAETGVTQLYVGEGDPTRSRLEQHARNKDFWTNLVLFTTKDESLNKAHVQYLEARILSLAREAKRCELDNGNVPELPSLSEGAEAESAAFLDDLLLCLPILGFHLLEIPEKSDGHRTSLFLNAKGIEGRGYDAPEGFVVLKGSTAAGSEVASVPAWIVDLRKSLRTRGIMARGVNGEVFAQDYAFNSPSAAAGVLLGRSANGRVEWKDAQGRTLKQIQSEE
jgi:hypothetical protein